LLTSEEQEALAKIPYLCDIPILGALCSKTNTERRKTELIIVATRNFVDPVKETDIKRPKFERTSDLERLLKLDLSKVDDEELENTIKAGVFN
ncbi:general secretion pathway protein GspD, partial [Vibrio sp. S457-15]